jgi:5'-nucleotidase (lipoprotein e(P4) family)
MLVVTMSTRLLPIALLFTLAAGCHKAPPPRVAAPPPPPTGATAQAPTGTPPPPTSVTTLTPAPARPSAEPGLEIRWVRDSAEFEAAVRQTYRMAEDHVERAAAGRVAGSWGVVLDADETTISNVAYQIEQAGRPYDETTWQAWAKRREATALPGAVAFLARVRALGGRIAIVTNRREAVCEDTKAVFAARGLAYDLMLCHTGVSDKNPRFDAVQSGLLPSTLPPLTVVAFVGDNIQDFPALSQAIKGGGDDAFNAFGSRFFVIPNPMYGSWLTR